MNDTDRAAADLLWRHWLAGSKLAALPEPLRPQDRTAGYAVQACLPAAGERMVVGWKLAATSLAGQRHIGVTGPLAGRVLSGQVDADGATVSLAGNGMCVAEPEFAFRFGADLPPRAVPYGLQEVLDAVDSLHPALEIPDSRYLDFARAGEAQLLADDACAHRFVLGPATPAAWRGLDLARHAVIGRLFDANGCRITREGSGSNVLGDPRAALVWLVNELASLALPLRAGEWVSTGTCMVPLEVRPGDTVHADYGALGALSVRFG